MAEHETKVFKRQKAIRDGGQVIDQTLGPYKTDDVYGYAQARCRVAYADISGRSFAANDILDAIKLDRDHYRPVMLGIRHGAGGGSATLRDRLGRFYLTTNPTSSVSAGSKISGPINAGFAGDDLSLVFPAANAAAVAPKIWCIFGDPSGEND